MRKNLKIFFGEMKKVVDKDKAACYDNRVAVENDNDKNEP